MANRTEYRGGDAAHSNPAAAIPFRERENHHQSPATSLLSAHPQQISEEIKQLQQYMQTIWDTTGHKCNANISGRIDVQAATRQWFEGSRTADGDTSLCVRRCEECRALTCLGCGESPAKREPRKVNDRYLTWCCLDGRLVTMWMMLCRFDITEIELRELNQQSAQSSQRQRWGTTSSGVSGVGYAALPPWEMGSGSQAWQQRLDIVQSKYEHPEVEDFFTWIMDVVTFALPDSQAMNLPPVLLAMLELSLLIDKAAELLRNDSLDNIIGRSKIFFSVLNLIGKIGAHQGLLRLVQEDRFSKTRSAGLQNISFNVDSSGATRAPERLLVLASGSQNQSLAKILENLAIQSELILGVPGSEPNLLLMCQQISSVYSSIKKQEPQSTPKLPKEQWDKFHKASSLTFNDAILPDFHALLQIEAGYIEREMQYSRTTTARNKRILGECANMRTSLDDGTFVIVAESRPDMMRALMIGPEDTSYANGLFEFDILLPADYPRSPPQIYIKLPYPIMINPNLHPDGKVCLSLLGTWFAGDATESWQPGVSTILQCLLSIRAMILVSDSLSQNAPIDMGTSRVEAASFDRGVQAQTIWFFMLNWIVDTGKRNGVWKSVIQTHFSMRRDKILRTVKQWTRYNLSLRKWTGHFNAGHPGLARLGSLMQYVPGFHRGSKIDLLEHLEKSLPHSTNAG